MAKTLQELLASRSPESQARIQQMADELLAAVTTGRGLTEIETTAVLEQFELVPVTV